MNTKITTLLLFALLLVFTSCDISDDNDTASNTGTLQVYMTDAPAAYEAVWIDIAEVRVHVEASEDIDSDDDGWIIVNDDDMRINLLDLTNGKFEVLGETQLETGHYSQMRLILGDDNEVVIDGVSHALDTPSAQQSGLKLNINAEIKNDEVYTLLLDFDASRSIVEAGNSGKYLLKPVLRTVELAATGSIEGTVQPAAAQAWVYAKVNGETFAGTKTEEDGDFRLIGLPSGSYMIYIEPALTGFASIELNNIEVNASDTTRIGVITLEN